MASSEARNRANYKYMTTKVFQKVLRFYPKDAAILEKVKDKTSGQIIQILAEYYGLNQ